MYVCAQIAAGFAHTLQRRWQTARQGEIMKRSAFRGRKSPELPRTWREAGYAASRANAADKDDDYVSGNIYDAEDERAEIDIIVHRMIHDAS